MDINAYLYRIGYEGSTKETLEVLNNLHTCHLLQVPFENLDIHYKIPIRLDLERIYDKIVNHKRGGFCYELNGLFFWLLCQLGFDAKQISARVYNSDTKEFGVEFDHLAIIVTIDDQEYLADVGFGEFMFTPLRLDIDVLQKDERGDYKVEKYNEEYFSVSKWVDGKKIPEYIFTKTERTLKEFDEMCVYNQTSPDSHFTQKSLISKPIHKGRITISGNNLKITSEGKETVEKKFNDTTAYANHLLEYFGLDEKEINTTYKNSF